MLRADQILNFWFGPPDGRGYGKPRTVWFTKSVKFDQEIRDRFLGDYQQAAAGELNHWQHLSLSCLALILLLDQFPRNMFRDTAKAFATDFQALTLAKYAIAQKFDQQLLPVQRWFIYLPFEHSENLADQQESIQLWSQLKADPESASGIAYAIRHQEIIQRFGRFPHRNQILGRETTPEEAEFLQQPGSRF